MEEETMTKKSNKVGLVIALIIVVVGIAIFYGGFFGDGVDDKDVVGDIVVNEELAVTDEEITAVVREALDTRNELLCDKIAKEDAKLFCLSNVIITKASDAQDELICNQLKDEYSQIACKDNIIIVRARDTQDASLCNSMIDKSRIDQCLETAQ